jgi:ADP-heptose:LPS heptosyltransferase
MRLQGCRIAKINKEKELKQRAIRPTNKDLTQLRHSVERYAEVFARLGYPIELTTVERHPRTIPAPFAPRTEGRWIGIAPFSKQEGKTYPSPLREKLVEMAAEEFNRVFIFSGGGAELEFANAMESRFDNITAVFGRIRLDEEIDLMANLDAVVSMDSSAMHMASLVGTPIVSVWGATHPATGFYGWGSDPASQIQIDLPCRPCSVYGERECQFGDHRCMHGIDPRLIFERLKAVAQ